MCVCVYIYIFPFEECPKLIISGTLFFHETFTRPQCWFHYFNPFLNDYQIKLKQIF